MSKAREILVLLAAGLLAAPLASQAAIVFTTDSATLLQGTFAFTGDLAAAETRVTTTFRLLPGPNDDLRQAVFGRRQFVGESSGSFFFGSTGTGNPNDPYVPGSLNANMKSFGPFSGSYTNGGRSDAGGTPVYWLFSNWQDTGGPDGIASGSFCFSTGEANCPGVPAVPIPAAAWLLLSGLGGLGFLGRRRKTA